MQIEFIGSQLDPAECLSHELQRCLVDRLDARTGPRFLVVDAGCEADLARMEVSWSQAEALGLAFATIVRACSTELNDACGRVLGRTVLASLRRGLGLWSMDALSAPNTVVLWADPQASDIPVLTTDVLVNLHHWVAARPQVEFLGFDPSDIDLESFAASERRWWVADAGRRIFGSVQVEGEAPSFWFPSVRSMFRYEGLGARDTDESLEFNAPLRPLSSVLRELCSPVHRQSWDPTMPEPVSARALAMVYLGWYGLSAAQTSDDDDELIRTVRDACRPEGSLLNGLYLMACRAAWDDLFGVPRQRGVVDALYDLAPATEERFRRSEAVVGHEEFGHRWNDALRHIERTLATADLFASGRHRRSFEILQSGFRRFGPDHFDML